MKHQSILRASNFFLSQDQYYMPICNDGALMICNGRYELDVEAIDNGVPSNVGVTILRISIAGVDDVSPRFDRSFYQEQLSEGNTCQ